MPARFLLLCGLSGLFASCVQRVYTSPAPAAAVVREHRTVALLPFYVQLNRPWLADWPFEEMGISRAEVMRRQRIELYQLAYTLQLELLGRLQAGRRTSYTVTFQPVAETNRRLQQAGIPYDSLNYRSTEELQRILDVDAVLVGEARLLQPVPGVVGALGQLSTAGVPGPPPEVTARLAIYDGRTGQLAWRFDHKLIGKARIQPVALAKELVRQAGPALPYRR